MNQSNKYQIYIKTDTLTYEEYFYFNPFQISIKKNGLNLAIEVGEIEFYDDLEANKLWQAKQSYNSTDIKILQNNQVVFESKFSLYNLPPDLSIHNAKIKPIPQATDANELLKKYDKEVDLLQGSLLTVNVSDDPIIETIVANVTPSILEAFGFQSYTPSASLAWDNSTNYTPAPSYTGDDNVLISSAADIATFGQGVTYPEHIVEYGGLYYFCIQANFNVIPAAPTGVGYWREDTTAGALLNEYRRTLRISYKTGYDTITIVKPGSNTATDNSITSDTKFFVDGILDGAAQNFTFTRLRNFNEMVEKIVNDCLGSAGILFESGTGANSWSNYILDSAEYNNMYLYHISDIKRPSATPPASFLKVKFSDFLKDMKLMFGLDWYINSSNYFQFIHPSERTTPTTIKDFTSVSKNNQVPKNKSSNVISKETFKFRNSGNDNFDEAQILYDSEGDVVGYSLERVCNNFLACTNDNAMIDDIGYGILNLDGSNLVQDVNEGMNATNLVINNLLYARPNNSGTINGLVKALNTSEQVELDTINAELDMNINEITIDLGFRTALTKKISGNPVATFSEIIYRTDSNLQEIKLLNI